jgi:hypothetical protein
MRANSIGCLVDIILIAACFFTAEVFSKKRIFNIIFIAIFVIINAIGVFLVNGCATKIFTFGCAALVALIFLEAKFKDIAKNMKVDLKERQREFNI